MVPQAVLFAPVDRHDWRETPHPELRPPTPRLALLPVGNKPLVLHALEELIAAGVEDIALVSETEVAEDVRELVDARAEARTVTHHVVDGHCGFIEALRFAAPSVGADPFIVHLCDSLRHDGIAHAFRDARIGTNDVLALVEPPRTDVIPLGTGLGSLRTAGVYAFGAGVLALASGNEPLPGWDAQIAAATQDLAEHGGHVELRAAHGCWRYHQRPDTLLQANRFFLSGLSPRPTEAWLENTDLQGRVAIDSSARLRSTIVRGPVIIGPDVEISDAYIGPYSSIGRGVAIENAEVENSIILPGASIRHLGVRLDASVVGPGARVFQDFRLPRACRLNVGERAEVAIT
jgi:glucose-1-phosphate thymidylyltransferase